MKFNFISNLFPTQFRCNTNAGNCFRDSGKQILSDNTNSFTEVLLQYQ